ncbi:MAG: hypothetical protein K1X57_04320 [Gemmataceae bacterium]|nr:hypothetical protein [Gemmataceae bacterium]
MNRTMIAFAAGVCLINGCRSTCRKPSCSTCAPPVSVYSAPPPTSAPTEILFEKPQFSPGTAPAQVPLPPPPAPTMPEQPRASSYTPKIENPSRVAGAPEILLEKPEFSETGRRDVASMKPASATAVSNHLEYREVVPGRLTTGPKPTLDDVDRLAKAGYKRVVVIGGPVSESDRAVFASRGITVETSSTPLREQPAGTYVYGPNPQVVRAWLISYLRETEFVSTEVATIRADRLLRSPAGL